MRFIKQIKTLKTRKLVKRDAEDPYISTWSYDSTLVVDECGILKLYLISNF